MELLRIKDNSAEKKAVFEGIPNLTCKIADKTLAQLEREENSCPQYWGTQTPCLADNRENNHCPRCKTESR